MCGLQLPTIKINSDQDSSVYKKLCAVSVLVLQWKYIMLLDLNNLLGLQILHLWGISETREYI